MECKTQRREKKDGTQGRMEPWPLGRVVILLHDASEPASKGPIFLSPKQKGVLGCSFSSFPLNFSEFFEFPQVRPKKMKFQLLNERIRVFSAIWRWETLMRVSVREAGAIWRWIGAIWHRQGLMLHPFWCLTPFGVGSTLHRPLLEKLSLRLHPPLD